MFAFASGHFNQRKKKLSETKIIKVKNGEFTLFILRFALLELEYKSDATCCVQQWTADSIFLLFLSNTSITEKRRMRE